ncbi:Ger(x)C family spore germination protein [Brevibacillus dissolubilis]|uniref:Ger(x)C family spore germination protein n=1 Tax=Brevibacillus dissolubilis TaxID=1844116 RepID=UPI001117A006|nr:Ger(x)C family spore germination protein [Brevibacillus dissolubilis]
MNKPLSVCLCIAFVILLSGCGKREISDLALVMAVGLDKGKQEGTVRVTAQIARPADARGQTGAPSGQTGEPIYSISAEGRTIFEAIRNLARFSSRRIFWAHNFVIVINEDYARDGIMDVIDFFSRNHELRMRTWVAVTPHAAHELVSTQTGLEVIPGQSVDRLFRYNEIVAEAPRTDMRQLLAAYLSRTSHPILARLTLKGRGTSNKKPQEHGSIDQVELSGTGIFRKDKLIGTLDSKESQALLYFTERVESAVVPIPCPDDKKNEASLELRYQRFTVEPTYQNGKIYFDVRLKTYVDMVESGCRSRLSQAELMQLMEEPLEKVLKERLEKVVKAAQRTYKVDFLELGKYFENKYPKEWKKVRDRWEEEFPRAVVRVHVETEINNPVLLEERVNQRGENK